MCTNVVGCAKPSYTTGQSSVDRRCETAIAGDEAGASSPDVAPCLATPSARVGPQKHRDKRGNPNAPFSVGVARPVGRVEIARTLLAQETMLKGRNCLGEQCVWDEDHSVNKDRYGRSSLFVFCLA